MECFLLECAKIPIQITTEDTQLADKFGGYHLVRSEKVSGRITIKVQAEHRPGVVPATINQPPEVSLQAGCLAVEHPYYRGTYSLADQEGAARVDGYFALISFIRVVLSVVIVDLQGLALHASCIKRNGQAHFFSGYSGAGKSTVIKLTDKPLLYSDELALVRKDRDGVFRVFHSPFRSEFYTSPEPPTAEIAGIFFLNQHPEVFLKPLSKTQALFELIPKVFFPITGRNPYESKIIDLCLDFLSQVRAASLYFKKDDTFWRCIDDKFGNTAV